MRRAVFSELPAKERQRFINALCAQGLSPAFADVGEMEGYLLGPVFETGSTYHTFWEGEEPLCGVGIVVREIAVKGEAYLSMLHVFAHDAEAAVLALLATAYETIRRFGGSDQTVVRIGVQAGGERVGEALAVAGCRPGYHLIGMVRSQREVLPTREGLRFRELGEDNLGDYLAVHNAAFLVSPNGAQMTLEEVEEMRRETRSPRYLQVGYAGGTPAAVLEVDVRGKIGQIQAIGVLPTLQRRGLGRETLAQALEVLAEDGAREVHLQVVDDNTPAVQLYRACGFEVDRVLSTWYVGPPISRFK